MNELDYLLRQIMDDINAIQNELSRGKATDYAEYQNLCGQIRGLMRAEIILKDLKSKLEQDDE